VLGPDITLAQVAARLRCSRCGMRRARMEALYRVRRETGGRGCVIGLGRVMECRGVWAPLSDLRAVEDIPRSCSFFFCELENEARVRGDRVLRGGSGRFATIFDTAMRQRRPTTPAGSFRGSSLIERPVSPGPGGTIGDAPSV
jgi:hypothetical protein